MFFLFSTINSNDKTPIGNIYKNAYLPPIKFEGLKYFKEQDVLTYLLTKNTVLRFNSPSYPISTLEIVLKQSLSNLYKSSGFYETKINFKFNKEAIIGTIKEGGQLIYGEFKVTGINKMKIELIEILLIDFDFKRFTNETYWKKGEGFFIEDKYEEKLQKMFDNLFLEYGYSNVDFELNTKEIANKENKSINLIVNIINENDLAIIKRITFEGADEKNQKAILETLELKIDDLYAIDKKRHWINLLINSGRFTDIFININRIGLKDIHLHFTIGSIHKMPPLDVKLTAHQAKIFSFLEQLSTLSLYKDGLQVAFKSKDLNGSGYYRNDKGLYLTLKYIEKKINLLIDGKKLYIALDKNSLYQINLPSQNIFSNLNIRARQFDPKQKNNEDTLNIGFGLSYQAGETKNSSILPFKFNISKAAILISTLKEKLTSTIKNNLITIYIKEEKVEKNIALQYQLVNNPNDKLKLKVLSTTMIFQKQKDFSSKWDELTKNIYQNKSNKEGDFFSFINESLVSSLINDLFSSLNINSGLNKDFILNLKNIFEPFKPHAKYSTSADFLKKMSASIENPLVKKTFTSKRDLGHFFQKFLFQTPLFLNDQLFEKGSWPWTISREYSFKMNDIGLKKLYLLEPLRIYKQKDTSFISCLLLIHHIKDFHPKLSLALIKKLSRNFNLNAFEKDIGALFKKNPAIIRDVENVLKRIALFDSKQIQLLCKSLDLGDDKLIFQYHQEFKRMINETNTKSTMSKAIEFLYIKTRQFIRTYVIEKQKKLNELMKRNEEKKIKKNQK
ncbi:MAG: hypothetical protein COA79_14260 [Planctomycetota bacterium]|nr:MAG: hypothetical protein COA79_14260 [Planctomycetota bacterium]